jgi:hypothetical protein
MDWLQRVPIPPYIQPSLRLTRHLHTLSFGQIPYPCYYYKYSFYPATIVFCNSPPSELVQVPTQGMTTLPRRVWDENIVLSVLAVYFLFLTNAINFLFHLSQIHLQYYFYSPFKLSHRHAPAHNTRKRMLQHK